MSQLFCSRRASSTGQALPSPSKFVPRGREQRMAWSIALSPFLGGATFHSLETWGFYWEEVIPERDRGKGCCHYLCGPLESPSKPRRKTGSRSELKDALEKVPEPLQLFNLTAWNSWARTPPTPDASFFLSFPSLPRLSPVSPLLHKPNPANWGKKRDEGPREAEGFNRRGWRLGICITGRRSAEEKTRAAEIECQEGRHRTEGLGTLRGKGSHSITFLFQ